MPHLPSRPDDHDPGSAGRAFFAGHQRHVIIYPTRTQIALVKNSQPSSQRNCLVTRSFELFALNQGLHTLPFAGPENTPSRSPPSSCPSSPTACSPCVLSD